MPRSFLIKKKQNANSKLTRNSETSSPVMESSACTTKEAVHMSSCNGNAPSQVKLSSFQAPFFEDSGLESNLLKTSLSLEFDQSHERIRTANQRVSQHHSTPEIDRREPSAKNLTIDRFDDVSHKMIDSPFIPVLIKQELESDEEDGAHNVVLERNDWPKHSMAEILRESFSIQSRHSEAKRSFTHHESTSGVFYEKNREEGFDASKFLNSDLVESKVKQEKIMEEYPSYPALSSSSSDEDFKKSLAVMEYPKYPALSSSSSEEDFKSFPCNSDERNKEPASLEQKTTKASGSSSKKYRYTCDVCDKSFSRSNTLTTHKRIHTGDKPFICEQCGRAFRQPGNLTRHRLTHTTVKPYVCLQCNKAFNRASNLHTHMRTHTNYKPFVCDFCGKGFHQKIDMKIHRYTHTGEKPHKCDKCGRGFKQLTHLTYHLRTHSDMRLYQCEYCGKGFNQKGNLQAHIYGHTGERPFKCEICGKGFTLASTLNTHKRTHAPKKPFQCQFCNKAFYQKNALKTHYIASHPYANGVSLL